MPTTKKAKQKLTKDIELVVKDAQVLLGALGDDLDQKTREAKDRLMESLEATKEQYDIAADRIREFGTDSIEHTDEIIRQHPYHAIGVSFVFGLLFGMLFHRK
jgi:ElaB/YqjD/DUF883 family membrane-anchored ribosome-binding protein